MNQIIVGYLIIMNVITFCLYGVDKQKAKKHKWRIPERTLLFVSFIGGSIGALTGMFCFRHKTKKWKFYLGNPVFLLLHLGIARKILGYF